MSNKIVTQEGLEYFKQGLAGETVGDTANHNEVFNDYGNNTVGENSKYCHVEGLGTEAIGTAQHVEGRYNEIPSGSENYLHIVGNGEDNDHRSNAYTLDKDGNGQFARRVTAPNIDSQTITASSELKIGNEKVTINGNGITIPDGVVNTKQLVVNEGGISTSQGISAKEIIANSFKTSEQNFSVDNTGILTAGNGQFSSSVSASSGSIDKIATHELAVNGGNISVANGGNISVANGGNITINNKPVNSIIEEQELTKTTDEQTGKASFSLTLYEKNPSFTMQILKKADGRQLTSIDFLVDYEYFVGPNPENYIYEPRKVQFASIPATTFYKIYELFDLRKGIANTQIELPFTPATINDFDGSSKIIINLFHQKEYQHIDNFSITLELAYPGENTYCASAYAFLKYE